MNHRTKNATNKKKIFYRLRIFGISIVAANHEYVYKLKRALEIIKEIDPVVFQDVRLLRAIMIYPGGTEYGCLFEKEKTYIDQPKSLRGSSLAWIASGIVHEAVHMKQYLRGMRGNNNAWRETQAYRFQRRFLKEIGSKADVHWLDKMYRIKWWKPERTTFKKKTGYDSGGVDRITNRFYTFIRFYHRGKLCITDLDP